MLSLRSVICKACQEQLLKTRLLISNLTGKWFMCAFRFPLVSYYQHPCTYYLTFMSMSYRVVGAVLNETQNLSHPVGNSTFRALICSNVEIQLTLPYVLYVLYVKTAVCLKWQVGFENDMKITPIFTINFSSKMLMNSVLHNWNILF